ncbi:MAG: glutamine amidotransferase [Pseudomonadales bacterium]|nr:glutamine amidotransferase [Pseudomonadales bacterium]
MTILIIKTGSTIASLKAQGQDFEDWFTDGMALSKTQVAVCHVYQGEALPALTEISGIIITGSPAYVTDEEEWNYTVANYCLAAHKQRIPILGICYGHQLLAWAFGGRVGFNPKGREIGSVAIRLSAAASSDSLLQGLSDRFTAQASHLQSVLELPEAAVLLGSNDCDPNHAFRLGESTWGLQFHPEFDAEISRAYIEERSAEIAAEDLDPQVLLQSLVESPESASLLPRFVEIVKATQA